MNILVSIFTTYILFRTLFSAPIDAPSSFYQLATGNELETPDRLSFKSAWINLGVFLIGYFIICAIQSWLMNTFAPQRSEVLEDISMTILSGQEFNVFFTLLKLVSSGLFGAFSLSAIVATILINLIYLAALTGWFAFTDITTNVIIPIIKPFQRPVVFAITIIVLFIYSMITYDPNTPFFQSIFRCVWELIDKVHLASCMATCIACVTTNDIIKVAATIAGHSTHLRRPDAF